MNNSMRFQNINHIVLNISNISNFLLNQNQDNILYCKRISYQLIFYFDLQNMKYIELMINMFYN